MCLRSHGGQWSPGHFRFGGSLDDLFWHISPGTAAVGHRFELWAPALARRFRCRNGHRHNAPAREISGPWLEAVSGLAFDGCPPLPSESLQLFLSSAPVLHHRSLAHCPHLSPVLPRARASRDLTCATGVGPSAPTVQEMNGTVFSTPLAASFLTHVIPIVKVSTSQQSSSLVVSPVSGGQAARDKRRRKGRREARLAGPCHLARHQVWFFLVARVHSLRDVSRATWSALYVGVSSIVNKTKS